MNHLAKDSNRTAQEKVIRLEKWLTEFTGFGSATISSPLLHIGFQIPVFSNQFWPVRKRAAHSLHEVPYRACFKPELPRLLIEKLSSKGDLVYDPFMGRGTTLLEAMLLERRALGNDINPLSDHLITPRLSPPTLEQVSIRLNLIPLQKKFTHEADLLAFFHPKTLDQLISLKSYFASRLDTLTLDPIDQWIRMVTTTRLTGHSKGFFSVYTQPPNQAVSAGRQRKLNATRNQAPEFRDIIPRILKKSKSLMRDLSSSETDKFGANPATVLTGPAHMTPSIETNSVDQVITSPPFLDTISYPKDNWLRCWFNDIDPLKVDSLHEFSTERWKGYMHKVFCELGRVIKPNGIIAMEVGEMTKRGVKLENLLIEAAAEIGLIPHCLIVHQQNFAKTANCWGITNGKLGTNSNRVLILSH